MDGEFYGRFAGEAPSAGKNGRYGLVESGSVISGYLSEVSRMRCGGGESGSFPYGVGNCESIRSGDPDHGYTPCARRGRDCCYSIQNRILFR